VDEPDFFDARALYWSFHWGRPAARELDAVGPAGMPRVSVQLGHFVGVEFACGGSARPGRGSTLYLASDRHGRRLYLLSPRGLEVDGRTPSGRVAAILYRTNKGDGLEVWRHAFEGTRPWFGPNHHGWPVFRRAGSGYRVTWRGIEG